VEKKREMSVKLNSAGRILKLKSIKIFLRTIECKFKKKRRNNTPLFIL